MAPRSSTLAWKIPWTEEPGGLLSMGSHRVRQRLKRLSSSSSSIGSVSYGKTSSTYEKEILSNYKGYWVYKVRNIFPKYL